MVETGVELLKASWAPTQAQQAEWKAKWDAMSPEERAQYRAEMETNMGTMRQILAASSPYPPA